MRMYHTDIEETKLSIGQYRQQTRNDRTSANGNIHGEGSIGENQSGLLEWQRNLAKSTFSHRNQTTQERSVGLLEVEQALHELAVAKLGSLTTLQTLLNGLVHLQLGASVRGQLFVVPDERVQALVAGDTRRDGGSELRHTLAEVGVRDLKVVQKGAHIVGVQLTAGAGHGSGRCHLAKHKVQIPGQLEGVTARVDQVGQLHPGSHGHLQRVELERTGLDAAHPAQHALAERTAHRGGLALEELVACLGETSARTRQRLRTGRALGLETGHARGQLANTTRTVEHTQRLEHLGQVVLLVVGEQVVGQRVLLTRPCYGERAGAHTTAQLDALLQENKQHRAVEARLRIVALEVVGQRVLLASLQEEALECLRRSLHRAQLLQRRVAVRCRGCHVAGRQTRLVARARIHKVILAGTQEIDCRLDIVSHDLENTLKNIALETSRLTKLAHQTLDCSFGCVCCHDDYRSMKKISIREKERIREERREKRREERREEREAKTCWCVSKHKEIQQEQKEQRSSK
mmetsp:Transcript_19008/g.56987  ORF Transcript_19008/g.56987 Transcript_19008/m.56987 type:complete len:518 (-) Transcript_19008:56-1609(-)